MLIEAEHCGRQLAGGFRGCQTICTLSAKPSSFGRPGPGRPGPHPESPPPYGEGQAVRQALTGIPIVLMVSGSEAPNRVEQHRTFIDAASDAGVEHLVYISFYGAAPDATFTLARDHWVTEEYIRERGLPATFLRDNMYLDMMPHLVGADGAILVDSPHTAQGEHESVSAVTFEQATARRTAVVCRDATPRSRR